MLIGGVMNFLNASPCNPLKRALPASAVISALSDNQKLRTVPSTSLIHEPSGISVNEAEADLKEDDKRIPEGPVCLIRVPSIIHETPKHNW